MHWYATVLFKNGNNKDFALIFFITSVKEISSFKKEIAELTEDDITTFFLRLSSVITVAINNKNKIVTKLQSSNRKNVTWKSAQ